jgi:hypothetical protein
MGGGRALEGDVCRAQPTPFVAASAALVSTSASVPVPAPPAASAAPMAAAEVVAFLGTCNARSMLFRDLAATAFSLPPLPNASPAPTSPALAPASPALASPAFASRAFASAATALTGLSGPRGVPAVFRFPRVFDLAAAAAAAASVSCV